MLARSNIILPGTLLVGIALLAVWKISPTPEIQSEPVSTKSEKRAPRLESPLRKSPPDLLEDDLLSIYHRKGAAAALAAAKSTPWPNRDARVFFILKQLASEDPEFAAAELMTSGLDTFLKGALLDTILQNWKDGRKALDWAENRLTGELHCKALGVALGTLVRTEPEAAFSYLEKIPACDARKQIISDLFSAWGSHNPETAMFKAKELAPEEAKSAMAHVVCGWALTDPEAAAAWVLKSAPTDGWWLAGIYQSLLRKSPEQARRWFDALPEGDAKNTVSHSSSGGNAIVMPVFSSRMRTTDDSWASKPVSERNDTDLMNWAIQDTEDARLFVEQNGNNPALKQLAAQVASAISGKIGPSEAMDWALRLPVENGNLDTALGHVLYEWAEKDPAAAARKL